MTEIATEPNLPDDAGDAERVGEQRAGVYVDTTQIDTNSLDPKPVLRGFSGFGALVSAIRLSRQQAGPPR